MIDPFFLDSAGGRIFCNRFLPADADDRGAGLLFLPPFAEELNKSRHVMARLGHRLAREGFTTLLPDLHGTGDSDGDFADARWDTWCRNAVDAAHRLRATTRGPLYVGGLRLGAALAVSVLDTLPESPRSLLLWQPVASGRTAMNQFLRLRVAGSLGDGDDRENVRELRERLAAGESLEVAGYELSPDLHAALEAIDLNDRVPPARVPLDWFEVSLDPAGDILPASRRLAERWSVNGRVPEPAPVGGDAFWATQELAGAPALVEQSAARLRARVA